MKRLVRIKADGIKSKYGYILDEYNGEMALIKVSNSSDWMNCVEQNHCIILGKIWYEYI